MSDACVWEEAYQKVKSLWGTTPDRVLQAYGGLVPNGAVLDLGIGEGRNALPFAQIGHTVEGLDLSPSAVAHCLKRAREAGYRFEVRVGDLRRFAIQPEKYALIIAAWTLNFMKKSEVEEVVRHIRQGLVQNGLVYIGVFSTADPGFERIRKAKAQVEENTYFSLPMNCHVHYFTRPEVLSLFPDLRLIHCAEGSELDVSHENPHYHGFVTYVGQKPPGTGRSAIP